MELRKCPFCGDAGKMMTEDNSGFLMSYVYCAKCGARTGDQTSEYTAALMWNMRYDEEQEDQK